MWPVCESPTRTSLIRLLNVLFAVLVFGVSVLTALPAAAQLSFAPPATYNVLALPRALASADLDGDGFPEAIVATTQGIQVLKNDGTGTFGSLASYPTGDVSNLLAVDLNDDQRPDVAFASGNSVGILLNRGDGTFDSPVYYQGSGANAFATSITSGDFYGFGEADLAVLTVGFFGSSPIISIFRNQGDGTFTSDDWKSLSGGAVAVTNADINGDGRTDLVTGNGNTNDQPSVSVLMNLTGGSFADPVNYLSDVARGVISSDVNNDGQVDVVLFGCACLSVGVMLNHGDGTLEAPAYYSTGYFPAGATVADFDADGQKDIATNVLGNIEILRGAGNGTFGAPITIATFPSQTGNPDPLLAADFDGNGTDDLLAGDNSQNPPSTFVHVLMNQAVITPAIPTINWQTPDAIVYGTALGDAQLNATATFEGTLVPGVFTYSPPAGTVLPAGTHTLSMTFDPTDDIKYASANGNVMLTVIKAIPTITVSGAFTYDGTPHPAHVAVTGVNGEQVQGEVTVTYDPGGTLPPTNAGVYLVSAIFTSSNANYTNATSTATTCTSLPDGVKGWWPGDGSGSDIVGLNSGSFSGDATTSAGFIGQAFRFSGAGTVIVPDAPALNPSRQLTIEAWINPSAAGNFSIIVNKEANTFATLNDIQYELALNGSSLAFVVGALAGKTGGPPDNLGGFWTDGGGSLPLDVWSHVSLTVDLDAGFIRTYVNGVQVKEYVVSTSLSLSQTSGDFRIGNRKLFPGAFNGLIDEVRLYNRALSANEIQSLYSMGLSGFCPGGNRVTIDPAVPTLNLVGGTFTYDGNPHPATATAIGVDGLELAGSLAISYTPGGSAPPVSPGTYSVAATFTSSNPNYTGASQSGEIKIVNSPPTFVAQTYSMPNGETGDFHYWDDIYSGSGCNTCNGAFLSGGLGKLTDGVLGSNNWASDPQHWVGWRSIEPTITFDFGTTQTFGLIRIHSNNAQTGGVFLWDSVLVDFSTDGSTFSNVLTFTPSAAQHADVTARFIDVSIPSVMARLVRLRFTDTGAVGEWIFLSEFEFKGGGGTVEPFE